MMAKSRNMSIKSSLEKKAIRVDTTQRNSLSSQKRIKPSFQKEFDNRILKVCNGYITTTIKDA